MSMREVMTGAGTRLGMGFILAALMTACGPEGMEEGVTDEALGQSEAATTVSGSIHANIDYNSNIAPSSTAKANSGGCNDYWAYFTVPYSPAVSQGTLRVWSGNVVNQAHIQLHSGLDGLYSCYSGWCSVSLCTKGDWGADASSIRIRY